MYTQDLLCDLTPTCQIIKQCVCERESDVDFPEQWIA